MRARCVGVCLGLMLAGAGACGVKGDPKPPLSALPPPVAYIEAIPRGDAVILSWPAAVVDEADAAKKQETIDTWGRTLPPERKRTEVAEYIVTRRQLSEKGFGVTRADVLTTVRATDPQKEWYSYADAAITPGAIYEYAIVTVDGRGRRAETVVKARTRWTTPPAPPHNVRAESHDEYVVVSWTPPKAPGDAAVEYRYLVYRRAAADPDAHFRKVTSTPLDDTSFTDDAVKNDVEYEYQVRTVRIAPPPAGPQKGIEGGPSDTVSVRPRDTTPPTPPWGVIAAPPVEGRVVTLRWSAGSDTDIVATYIYRRRAGGKFRRIATVSEPTRVYRDTGIAAPGTYEYCVTSVDEAGNESRRSQIESVKLFE